MSTKRSAKKCKVPAGKKPNPQRYTLTYRAGSEARALAWELFRQPTAKSDDSLPPPHDWPAYGGKCWQPAYPEMIATQALAYSWLAYEAAKSAGYMPAYQLAKYAAAYTLAKIQYLAAWGAMEDCLGMIV